MSEIEVSIHTDKPAELRDVVQAMAKFQGVEVKTQSVLRVRTECRELADALKMLFPDKAVLIGHHTLPARTSTGIIGEPGSPIPPLLDEEKAGKPFVSVKIPAKPFEEKDPDSKPRKLKKATKEIKKHVIEENLDTTLCPGCNKEFEKHHVDQYRCAACGRTGKGIKAVCWKLKLNNGKSRLVTKSIVNDWLESKAVQVGAEFEDPRGNPYRVIYNGDKAELVRA